MLSLSNTKLDVYAQAMKIITEVYLLTNKFPASEIYGLTTQLRRAAVSVVSNIAEGAARISPLDKRRFYVMARSSLVEIDTQIEISINLNFLGQTEIETLSALVNQVFAMLSKMIRNLTV